MIRAWRPPLHVHGSETEPAQQSCPPWPSGDVQDPGAVESHSGGVQHVVAPHMHVPSPLKVYVKPALQEVCPLHLQQSLSWCPSSRHLESSHLPPKSYANLLRMI